MVVKVFSKIMDLIKFSSEKSKFISFVLVFLLFYLGN